MKTIVILSSFSSGSTALAGFLERCGAHTCPPHMITSDKRTPLSYENIFLKDALEELFDTRDTANQFEAKGCITSFHEFFGNWYQNQLATCKGVGKKFIVIKNPLLTFTLPAVNPQLENPFYLILKRPFDKIENTRVRRNWAPLFGKTGAKIIYQNIAKQIEELNLTHVDVYFETFCKNAKERLNTIKACQIETHPDKLRQASDWLRT